MAFGTLFAMANGAVMPLFALFWGDMLDAFSETNIVDSTR